MRLSRVQIVNFRSIENATLHFNYDCRVLVGINEAGKSNILRALSTLTSETELVPDDVRLTSFQEQLPGESFVRFVFKFDETDHREIYSIALTSVHGLNLDGPLVEQSGKGLSLFQICEQISEGLYCVDVLKKRRYGSVWTPPKSRKLAGTFYTPTDDSDGVAGPSVLDEEGEPVPLSTFSLLSPDSITGLDARWVKEASVATIERLVLVAVSQ